jgi:lysophospholipase
MKACREIRYASAGHDLHMESDDVRDAWLAAVTNFTTAGTSVKTQSSEDDRHGL